MSNYSNNAPLQFGTELAATMSGTWVKIGTLPVNPAKLIFDNQGTASVAISVNDGLTTWKTFTPGEGLVIDEDLASNMAGTTFWGNGASGTFSISYLYVKLS